MIIHSDFMINGILKIEKYDDRIVLTNPGLLKLPLEQIYKGGESKARNQRIQNIFLMIGYGENLGSGFPLILSAWDEKNWEKPQLIEQQDLMQIKLTLYLQKHQSNDPKQDPKHDPKHDPKTLTQRQMKIIGLIEANNSITREELSKQLSISESTIKREISTLKDIGILKREGGRYAGTWIVKL